MVFLRDAPEIVSYKSLNNLIISEILSCRSVLTARIIGAVSVSLHRTVLYHKSGQNSRSFFLFLPKGRIDRLSRRSDFSTRVFPSPDVLPHAIIDSDRSQNMMPSLGDCCITTAVFCKKRPERSSALGRFCRSPLRPVPSCASAPHFPTFCTRNIAELLGLPSITANPIFKCSPERRRTTPLSSSVRIYSAPESANGRQAVNIFSLHFS